ncbi:hypothetical protein [Clostridium botulinum]|uniref:hypothetical protein n=1 Tax=Clostridium botulinum TaxID=1491 RepID=UPI001967CFC4|nr:hypothetical protein [Clostridium botulinum]MBN1058576.1 hypothetical protein [Clostridium botulinum]
MDKNDVIEVIETDIHEVNNLLKSGNYILLGVGRNEEYDYNSHLQADFKEPKPICTRFIYSLGRIK